MSLYFVLLHFCPRTLKIYGHMLLKISLVISHPVQCLHLTDKKIEAQEVYSGVRSHNASY